MPKVNCSFVFIIRKCFLSYVAKFVEKVLRSAPLHKGEKKCFVVALVCLSICEGRLLLRNNSCEVCVCVCIYVCIFPNESMKLGELYGDWYDLSVWLKERVRDSSD